MHMRRVRLAVSLMALLEVAATALAMDQPTIQAPAEGAVLGPNYDISGSLPYRALLVVMTDCIRVDTDELVRSVPGIRHWTDGEGRFQFRCASPRIYLGTRVTLRYRVRCFEANAAGELGPEAVVACH